MNKLNTRIVLRNDSTANWLAESDQILLKGEVGIEFLSNGKVKMKIGDGEHTWAQLGYFGGDEGHVFEATISKGGDHLGAITEVVGSTTLSKGDVAIVKEAIVNTEKVGTVVDGTTIQQKYQYTAYVYNGSSWAAMDGNYSAENVYFDDDFTFTTNIGTVTGVTSSKVVSAAGKNLKQFLSGLFAQETPGSISSEPSCGVVLKLNGSSISSDVSYEVGTTIQPSYTTSFEDGKYTYGPEPTGVTVDSWSVTSTAGETWNTATGSSASSVTLGDKSGDVSSYSITAVATHTNGNYAKSNIGNTGTTRIASGTKSATTKKVTCYRTQFAGCSSLDDFELTSSSIRGLKVKAQPTAKFSDNGASGKVNTSTNGFKLAIDEGSKYVIIALYGRTLQHVYDSGAFGQDIVGSFTHISADTDIAVSGANNYSGVNYNVYVYSPSTALGANTYDIVIG